MTQVLSQHTSTGTMPMWTMHYLCPLKQSSSNCSIVPHPTALTRGHRDQKFPKTHMFGKYLLEDRHGSTVIPNYLCTTERETWRCECVFSLGCNFINAPGKLSDYISSSADHPSTILTMWGGLPLILTAHFQSLILAPGLLDGFSVALFSYKFGSMGKRGGPSLYQMLRSYPFPIFFLGDHPLILLQVPVYPGIRPSVKLVPAWTPA